MRNDLHRGSGWTSARILRPERPISLGGSGSALQVVSAADAARFVDSHGAPVATRAKLGVVRFVDRRDRDSRSRNAITLTTNYYSLLNIVHHHTPAIHVYEIWVRPFPHREIA